MPAENPILGSLAGSGQIDAENGIIPGASIMTVGPTLGHPLVITQEGIQEAFQACSVKGEVTLAARHNGEIYDIVGAVRNFRIDGSHLRGDIHLLNEHPMRGRILELASKQPDSFGLSVESLPGVPKTKKPVPYKCTDMLAIAFAMIPAANKSLFSAGNNNETNMTTEELQAALAAALDPVSKALQDQGNRLEALQKDHTALAAKMSGKKSKKKDDAKDEGDEEEEDENEEEDEEETKMSAVAEKAALKAVTAFASKLGIKRAPKASDENGNPHATEFMAKVAELSATKGKNAFSAAVMKYPELYAAHCEKNGNSI